MSCWLVEPRDPLIARDGRPANNLRFTSTRFPFPSMLAGAARTRMGSENGAFSIPREHLGALKEIAVHGPLLAELHSENGGVLQWLAPAPRDANLTRGDDERVSLRCLRPRPLEPGQRIDSLEGKGLMPVSASGLGSDKPLPEAPAFWAWEHFERWLATPQDSNGVIPESLGILDLAREERTHLAIQPDERVGLEGQLFLTSGLRFLQPVSKKKADRREFCLCPRRFALSLRSAGGSVAGRPLELREETAPLGGERRLARWSSADRSWPALPDSIRESILRTRRARLILLTPGFFSEGALPGWSGKPWPSEPAVKVNVQAACVGRPEIVSGWDLAIGRPKPTRRLAGAGSVYFVEILCENEENISRWCDAVWLAPVNDPENDSNRPLSRQPDLDGFGLAALGTWEKP